MKGREFESELNYNEITLVTSWHMFQSILVRKLKALHYELLTDLSSQFASRNEFFAISKVQV